MPCDTKVLVNLENTKWIEQARKKMGLPIKGGLEEKVAKKVRIEAGKLKAAAAIKAINPSAMITGLTVGSKKLTINIEI